MKVFYIIFLNDYISEFVEFDKFKRISTSKFVKFNRFKFYFLRLILIFFDFVNVFVNSFILSLLLFSIDKSKTNWIDVSSIVFRYVILIFEIYIFSLLIIWSNNRSQKFKRFKIVKFEIHD